MRASKTNGKPNFFAVANLILIKKGKVLLEKRSKKVWKGGFYGFPAGHIEGEEKVFDALKREICEELGITISERKTKLIHVTHRISDNGRVYFDFYYTTSHWKGKIKNCEPDKKDELAWFPIKNFPKTIIPHHKRALSRSKKGIFFSEDRT